MTFYFYDLETSGISSRAQRIMQFAGQRTDMDLNPIGEPDNWIVRLTDEVLPDPDAVLITGITPQKTLEEGYTEFEFINLFTEHVCQPDTIITGFNNVRFDDEFIRNTLWRNFHDPYQWQWQDGRSRWDLMDVVRMVRALRPEGIEWPFDKAQGKPSNRLELITELNGISHDQAHDALSDVYATIAVAKLLKEKQPKMFEYLLGMRSKKIVAELAALEDPKPFLYTSGRYANSSNKTTAVLPVAPAANGSVLVYDLRIDPVPLSKLSDDELCRQLFSRDSETELLPVKVLKPNACPAVAPLGVLDEAAQESIQLTPGQITENYSKFCSIEGFGERIGMLFEAYDSKRKSEYSTQSDADFQLYDGFIPAGDAQKQRVVRTADANTLVDLSLDFSDPRLEALFVRYKARNFSRSLSESEQKQWEAYRDERIMNGTRGQLSAAEFGTRLAELSVSKTDEQSKFLLTELQLYAESIMPTIDA